MSCKFKSAFGAILLNVTVVLAGLSAKANNLVTNGSFEVLSGGIGQIGYGGTTLTDWSNSNGSGGSLGYNFIFSPGSGDTTGANGTSGNVKLWGPNDGSNNDLPTSSPDGGNFIAADGSYEVGAISQTIIGLTAGDKYTVGFWWAAAQQAGFDYATPEQWLVSLGNQQLTTSIVTDPSHGFSGWIYTSLTFTADSSSDVLSFLAKSTPGGEPPFSLLDGVTMVAVPEPTSITLLATGLLLFGIFVWRRREAMRRSLVESATAPDPASAMPGSGLVGF